MRDLVNSALRLLRDQVRTVWSELVDCKCLDADLPVIGFRNSGTSWLKMRVAPHQTSRRTGASR